MPQSAAKSISSRTVKSRLSASKGKLNLYSAHNFTLMHTKYTNNANKYTQKNTTTRMRQKSAEFLLAQ